MPRTVTMPGERKKITVGKDMNAGDIQEMKGGAK
jgi:hypothetical protein